MIKNPIFRAGLLLGVFAVISIFFVSWTHQSTESQIKFNEKQVIIKRLNELVKGYDNDILKDKTTRLIRLHGVEQKVSIYPAKKNNRVFAYLIEHTYPRGYNGNIRLLTGFDVNYKLLGVRVITHQETPGLGDKIETKKSNWIKQFQGLSLTNPAQNQWKVKRDGGVFDAFTGATITPRAIVSAAYQVLVYFSKNEIK